MDDVNIRVHLGGQTHIVTSEELHTFARAYELDQIAPGRYSSLFVLNILLLSEVQRINPAHVIEEVKALEGKGPSSTKPATEFRGKHLQGLWHKHFLPPLPSVLAHNILNQLGKSGMRKIADEVFGPHMGKIATKEMVDEFTTKIVNGSLLKRSNDGRLTGEWIVFAKENGKNYYLGIWSHVHADEDIASSLKAACLREFPFLGRYLQSS